MKVQLEHDDHVVYEFFSLPSEECSRCGTKPDALPHNGNSIDAAEAHFFVQDRPPRIVLIFSREFDTYFVLSERTPHGSDEFDVLWRGDLDTCTRQFFSMCGDIFFEAQVDRNAKQREAITS